MIHQPATTLNVGTDASGSDVTFYGSSPGSKFIYDASANTVLLLGLPTSDPSVVGQLWKEGTDLKISEG